MTQPRSRTEVAGRTRRARVARSVGPEVVAGLSSVAALAVIAALMIGPMGTASPSPSDQVASAVSSPSASATSTAAPPSAGPTASLWAAQASVLLGAEQRLAEIRDRLAAALDEVPTSTTGVARELRTMNTTLKSALDAIASMASSGAPPELIADLEAAHDAALAVSLETLQASVQNGPVYESGGAEVVALLDEISNVAERVRLEAGLQSPEP